MSTPWIRSADRGRSVRFAGTGFTLIELTASMAIGLFLIGGAVYAIAIGRNAYRTNEILARLQEQARYALVTLEPDIELAGYYGFTHSGQNIALRVPGTPASHVVPSQAMRQNAAAGESAPAPVAVAASAHACGRNFAVDVRQPVQGSNGVFALGPDPTSACAPYPPGAQHGADTLTLRRVEVTPSKPDSGRLQVYASRLQSQGPQLLFDDGSAPGPLDTHHEIHDMFVRAFYIARQSVEQPNLPALRAKTLTTISGTAAFLDTEIMSGVEDLQVQFAVEQPEESEDDLADRREGPGDERSIRYVNPGDPSIERSRVLAVRVWLRVRSDQPELGYVDDRIYRYADIEFMPSPSDSRFRRIVMSRTIAVRNARNF